MYVNHYRSIKYKLFLGSQQPGSNYYDVLGSATRYPELISGPSIAVLDPAFSWLSDFVGNKLGLEYARLIRRGSWRRLVTRDGSERDVFSPICRYPDRATCCSVLDTSPNRDWRRTVAAQSSSKPLNIAAASDG